MPSRRRTRLVLDTLENTRARLRTTRRRESRTSSARRNARARGDRAFLRAYPRGRCVPPRRTSPCRRARRERPPRGHPPPRSPRRRIASDAASRKSCPTPSRVLYATVRFPSHVASAASSASPLAAFRSSYPSKSSRTSAPSSPTSNATGCGLAFESAAEGGQDHLHRRGRVERRGTRHRGVPDVRLERETRLGRERRRVRGEGEMVSNADDARAGRYGACEIHADVIRGSEDRDAGDLRRARQSPRARRGRTRRRRRPECRRA